MLEVEEEKTVKFIKEATIGLIGIRGGFLKPEDFLTIVYQDLAGD